jgi:ATP-dependent Zn protease
MKQEKKYLNIILLVFAAGMIFIWFFYVTNQDNQPYVISYTEFRENVEEGRVSQVVFNGQQIDGTFEPPLVIEPASEGTKTTESYTEFSPADFPPATETTASETTKIESFRTYLPPIPDNELLDILEQKKVTVETRAPNNSSRWVSLLSWVPMLIIALLIFQWMRGMSAGQGEGITNMLQSRAKLYDKQKRKVTFQDVAGLGRVKQELQEVVDFLQNPWRFQSFGATVPKGVLLVGPPGTGKTLLARAVAGEAAAAFFPIGGSDFIELFVGVGASRVRHLFKQARENEPAIIFID